MSEVKDRLFEASEALQELAEQLAALILEHPTKEYPSLTPNERTEVASALGQVAGIGIGLSWIAKYEVK
jgi:hypothetical protein